MQEQQPEPRVLPPRMTEGVQELTELRRDETAFEQSLRQFMQQENIGVSALAKRLGKSHGTVSKWLSGKKVCSTQAEVLHKLGLGPPPPELPPPRKKRRKQLQGLNRAIRIIRKATKRPVIIHRRRDWMDFPL